jgi:subtilisin family serine protease
MKTFPERIQHPSGATMTRIPDKVMIRLESGPQAAALDRGDLLDKLGLVEDQTVAPMPGRFRTAKAEPSTPREHPNTGPNRIWARSKGGESLSADALEERGKQAGAARDGVAWMTPVYRVVIGQREELLAPVVDAVLVRPAPRVDEDRVRKLLSGYGLSEDAERSALLGAWRYYRVDDPAQTDALDVLARLSADAPTEIRDARIEHIPYVRPSAYIPNDGLFADQWNMVQVMAGGPGKTAWNLQRGDADIVICVLDEGCDLGHPDLMPYAGPGVNLGDLSLDGSPTGNHGTACAGIAAAATENSTGVAGMAGNCRVLPVAFDTWSDSEVAAGIRYAVQQGARVISMSFGWNGWDPDVIDPAIQEAFDAGLVMCVATHNHNSNVITYPATNPLVIAVGASDQVDNRKSPTSPDGEGWGSNFGPAISVAAPGVLIPTTDIRGANQGYNPDAGPDGGYHMTFNGTSAATPHVAGLAALLLSCDDTLTNIEVRDIIEQTADKVGSVPYANLAGYPNGTWNQEMGYGRINALSALQQVCKRFPEFKRINFDKMVRVDKSLVIEDFGKLDRFKEKERIDELKVNVGYEAPDFEIQDRFGELLQRLDRLEQTLAQGRAFIAPAERPDVGTQIARTAGLKRRR